MIDGGVASALTRVSLTEKSFDEAWLQGLLFRHPALVPIDEIEPIFGPLVPLARELPTETGPVDVVYLNPEGYLTLVETKLWRNPEARRQVVAQIIDYAAAISRWDYLGLAEAARRAGAAGVDPLREAVGQEEGFDEARFADAVARNLSKGRFLLLIAGDGIQEGVEHLAGTLARSPHLGFTLGLLELAVYRAPGDSGAEGEEGSLFVQPRLLARTREVVRAVVEIRTAVAPSEVAVTLPAEGDGQGGNRRKLTEEVFFEKLAASAGQAVADGFRAFLVEAEKLGVEVQGRDASVSLFWYEPNTGRRFSFGSVYWDGAVVSMHFVVNNYRKEGLDDQIGLRYVRAVAGLVPGAVVRDGFRTGKNWARIFVGERELALADVLPHAEAWLRIIEGTIAETEQAGAAKAGAAR